MTAKAISMITISALSISLHAATVYVGPEGKEGNPGSREEPLASIQSGIDMCNPGDVCVVLAGIYRESIQFTKSGAPGKPISLQSEGEVILDGCDPVAGQWEKFEKNTIRTKLPGPVVEQAFINDAPLTAARWPNADFKDLWIRSVWARSAEGSHKDLMICNALAETGIDWSGAIAVLNVGHQYKTWTRKILSHQKGSTSFTYALEEKLGDGKDDGRTWGNDCFYITGSIKALDAPGEFYHDAQEGYFYLYVKDEIEPKPGAILVKLRNYGITAKGVSHIRIKGFKLFGCALQLKDSAQCVVENCDIRFPSYVAMIGETMPKKERFPTPTVSVYGNNNTFRKLHVAYAYASGIIAAGYSNIVEECIVHNVCWSGTINHSGISIRPYKSPDRMTYGTIRRCTVYSTGNVGIYYTGGHNTIEYNHVHHTGLACHDIAAIHTGSPATAGSVAHHNWVHHSMGLAMRGDDQTRELTVHHNLVWECDQGIIVKGNRNKVYNNTILGRNGHGCMTIPTQQEPKKWWTPHPILPVQNIDSLFFNNYCEDVVYRRDPIPQNSGILHNITYKDKTPYTNSLELVDEIYLESGTPNARPRKGSEVIDAGVDLDGVTDAFTESAPDAGAYEYGMPLWKAGASWKPPADIFDLPIEAEVARSWALSPKHNNFIPMPVKFRNSKVLSGEFKTKLQSIYASCWKKDEINRRRTAIHKRGKPESATYAEHHKVVAELHKLVYQRFVEKAKEQLKGDELELFLRAGR